MSWFTKAYRIPKSRFDALMNRSHSHEIIKETHTKKGNVMVELDIFVEDAYGQIRSNRVIVNKDWM